MRSQVINRNGVRAFAIVAAVVTSVVGTAQAEPTAEAKGTEIAELSDKADQGYNDSRVTLEMILRNPNGDEIRRVMDLTTLEINDAALGDKTLTVFREPTDVQGTAFLSHTKILEPDDQWLYLPALNRTKRISSANKTSSFMGSEFTYEDMTGDEFSKFDYKWIREEPCGAALTCDVVERIPRYEHSGYSRQLVSFDRTYHQFRKVEYYDRKGALLKTETHEDYKLYNNKFWRPQVIRTVNHQNNKGTDLKFHDYVFGVGLKESDFTKEVLTRVQ